MKDRRDYVFTHHLRERYLERTRNKYKHLHSCRQSGCELCRNLVMDIKEQLQSRRVIDQEIALRLDRAVECRGYLNDSKFMSWYYEKYGTDRRFEFLVDGDICFVAIHGDRKVVVTCVWSKSYSATRQVLRPKFKKRKENAEILLSGHGCNR